MRNTSIVTAPHTLSNEIYFPNFYCCNFSTFLELVHQLCTTDRLKPMCMTSQEIRPLVLSYVDSSLYLILIHIRPTHSCSLPASIVAIHVLTQEVTTYVVIMLSEIRVSFTKHVQKSNLCRPSRELRFECSNHCWRKDTTK